ncbi:MAG: class I SAM-dependent methyltransferase [Syntrophobacteraceae bacterium]
MQIEEYARKHRHFWASAYFPPELRFILDTNSFDSLIDIGCGNGALLNRLKTLGYLKNKHVWAVDFSETRLDSVKAIDSSIVAVQDDAQFLEKVPDSHFDLIISSQVIEHVLSDQDMISALSRIARPNALVYLDTVFKKSYGWYFYRNRHGRFVLDPTHEREYTSENSLYQYIRNSGFRIVHSSKEHMRFSPSNYVIRKLGVASDTNSKVFSILSKLKIPVPRYFYWKILMVKQASLDNNAK